MAKPEQIVDADQRSLVEQAHTALRAGDPTTTVRLCSDAYVRSLRSHPALESYVQQAGRLSPLNWPRLGTQLTMLLDQPPSIRLERDRYAFSEAATIYEFTVDSIVAGQRFVGV